jgi:hypothetical protein
MIVVPARQDTHDGRIDSLESILDLLKSLKIRAQLSPKSNPGSAPQGGFSL